MAAAWGATGNSRVRQRSLYHPDPRRPDTQCARDGGGLSRNRVVARAWHRLGDRRAGDNEAGGCSVLSLPRAPPRSRSLPAPRSGSAASPIWRRSRSRTSAPRRSFVRRARGSCRRPTRRAAGWSGICTTARSSDSSRSRSRYGWSSRCSRPTRRLRVSCCTRPRTSSRRRWRSCENSRAACIRRS